MLPRSVWILVLLLVLSSANTDEDAVDHVIELGDDDFDTAISTHTLLLVEFYAPWCGHCKSLAPEYEKAAQVLSAIGVPLAKVDATVHTQVASQYSLKGYPTLKVFHDGVAYDYEGPRKAAGIIEYMQKEASPDWRPPADEVQVLTSENFTSIVTESELILVEFYAPWCGHCKALEPDYKKAASDLSVQGIPLAKVDGTVEGDLAKQYDVKGYPTLILFRKGKKFPYNGPRERQGLVNFMVEQSTPASLELSSYTELSKLQRSKRLPIVVACFDSTDDGYQDVSNDGRESPLTFTHSNSLDLCTSIGVEFGSIGILQPDMYRSKYEPSIMTFELSKINLTSLVLAARPLVAVREKSTQQAWFSDYPLLVTYLEIDTSREGIQDFSFWQSRLLEVATLFPELTVGMSDERQYQDELVSLGLSDWGEDVAMVLWAGPKEKYILGEDMEVGSITTFIEDFHAGRLSPFIRSQPRPKRNTGPVITVVGSTFEEIVLDRTKHVLLEFYAPWCGHCKSLEPKYKKLAKKFKKQEDIVIAKFDATANDALSGFDFSGFPTLFFVSAIDNEVVLYEGQREVKAMTGFIKKQVKKFKREKDEL